MSRQRRKGPRNTIDRRDKARRNDRFVKGGATNRPFKAMKGAAALLEEYGFLKQERERLALRLAYLRLLTPKAGCEELAEEIIERYEVEIDEMPVRLSALKVKLERAGVRI